MVRRVQKQVPRRCSTSHQQRHYFRSYGRSRSSSSGERTQSRSATRETRTKRKRTKRGRECGAGPRPAPREKRAQHLMIGEVLHSCLRSNVAGSRWSLASRPAQIRKWICYVSVCYAQGFAACDGKGTKCDIELGATKLVATTPGSTVEADIFKKSAPIFSMCTVRKFLATRNSCQSSEWRH